MPPGFQSYPPKSLALIRSMDWILMRHSLHENKEVLVSNDWGKLGRKLEETLLVAGRS